MLIDVEVHTEASRSARALQLCGAFDVPIAERQSLRWRGDLPIEDRPWTVGLIVGPSGCGKSTIMRALWGDERKLEWHGRSVIDDFPEHLPVDDIVAACSAVGFNTIPAWLRPFHVLSNGEKFRVELARRLLEAPDDGTPIVVDEFTSVVDRQVAAIGSQAVAKYVRRTGKQFVAVTCHFDVIDWLQPDWVYEPATNEFTWRSVQPRPRVDVAISPVGHDAWRLFAPYHYMSPELSRSARCFVAFVGEERTPAAFAGILFRPTKDRLSRHYGISRVVTLPDWQGLGLAFTLIDTLGAAYKARSAQLLNYPAHPAFIRAHDRSPHWQLMRKPAARSVQMGPRAAMREWRQGGRACAVFRYIGKPDDEAARVLLDECGANPGGVRRS